MPFLPGDDVVVRSLNRRGRVVDARGGRYRIAIGTVTVTAEEGDLRAAESGKKRARRSTGEVRRAPATGGGDEGRTHRVDLHGLTVEAAREAVIAAVNAAALEGALTVEIVHGIGTGRVRTAAWETLRHLSVVRHIRAHPTNKGVTLADL